VRQLVEKEKLETDHQAKLFNAAQSSFSRLKEDLRARDADLARYRGLLRLWNEAQHRVRNAP
jgi:hypothetical protein